MCLVSYGITTHNEGYSIQTLLDTILNVDKNYDFEIVILDDNSTDKVTVDILNLYNNNQNVNIKFNKFNNNFAEHKNLLNSYCTGDYIFNIDADETIDVAFVENIDTIIESNTNIELFWVPRTNIVHSLTDYHVRAWRWKISTVNWLDVPVINFPDWQGRIYKNIPDKIKWEGKIHEIIKGAKYITYLPPEKEYCIMHEKTIFKQEQQNKFYGDIFNG